MKALNIKLIIAVIGCSLLASCSKQNDFLDKKKNNFDVIPDSLNNFQAILDQDLYMNYSYPALGMAGSDNYYVTGDLFNSLVSPSNTAYVWDKDIFQGMTSGDWNGIYQIIGWANIVLDGLKAITPTPATQTSYNNVQGSALFFRAYGFYNVAALWCKSYDSATAASDIGIPLQLTSDITKKATRSTVQQTYDQMIADLKTALPLLPARPLFPTRPSAAAVNALLAKIYLSAGDYADAALYANASLGEKSELMDFNDPSLVIVGSPFPFPSDVTSNPETVFYAAGSEQAVEPMGIGIIDSGLYRSYDDNDLRKTVFYTVTNGLPNFTGSYDGYYYSDFTGIATNEVYLIRAECAARMGDAASALQDLNSVLVKRWITGTFTPLAAPSADSALSLILHERRKELPFTGVVSWEDLRRLNKDPRFARTLIRVLNGTTYTLPPNDPRYVYPIPDNEIQLSGIQQNPR
jgi:hypothetical protein